MPKQRPLSKYMQKAINQLDQAKGRKSSLETLEREAVSLASLMLLEATKTQSRKEKQTQKQLSRMMGDSKGKAFTTKMTDQCFRSHKSYRVADQLSHLLNLFGIPK